MRIIEKHMASLEIASLCYSVYDGEKIATKSIMSGIANYAKIRDLYDGLIYTVERGKKTITQKYNIAELGLLEKVDELDRMVQFLRIRKQQFENSMQSQKTR